MKAETTKDAPLVDLTHFEGPVGQAHAEAITHVLLNDGVWYEVIPGSFHLYKTAQAVPYAQFDTKFQNSTNDALILRRVQCFPATVAGWASAVPGTEVAE